MANSQRRKGLVGEREVARIFRANQLVVQNLDGSGDLNVRGGGLLSLVESLHVEVKRQERIRMAWIDQAETEAPAGAVPVVAFRRSHGKWHAIIGLEDLARLLA